MATRLSSDRGDGPPCPEAEKHGRTYMVTSRGGQLFSWCPVTQALFAPPVYTGGVMTAGRLVRAGYSRKEG